MDIRAFFIAFFSDLVGWMSGLGSIAFTVWALLRPNGNQKKGFLLLAVVCFFVACIHIWTIEHRARLAAEDARKPDITVSITTDMSGLLNGDHTVLTLVFTAINRGAPSFLELQGVFVELPGGARVQGRLLPNQDKDMVLGGAPGTPDVTLARSDYILSKFLEKPLTRGIKTSAWGAFVLPGVPQSSIVPLKTTIEADFIDIDGNPIRTKLLIGSGPNRMYMPGKS